LGEAGCGLLNGREDPRVRAAAADVAAHGVRNLLFGRIGSRLQQAYRRHDLASLAIAALRDVIGNPGRLHRPADRIGFHAFDGGELAAGGHGDGRQTGSHGRTVDMHRTGAAQGHAAAELGAGHAQFIAQDP